MYMGMKVVWLLFILLLACILIINRSSVLFANHFSAMVTVVIASWSLQLHVRVYVHLQTRQDLLVVSH